MVLKERLSGKDWIWMICCTSRSISPKRDSFSTSRGQRAEIGGFEGSSGGWNEGFEDPPDG